MESTKKINQASLDQLVVLMSLDPEKVKVLAADRFIVQYEQFLSCPELEETHAGFQSKTSIKETMFEAAWIVGEKVYVHYKIEGNQFVKMESIGSSLDNGGVHQVVACASGIIILQENAYSTCPSNMKEFRRKRSILTSVYTD